MIKKKLGQKLFIVIKILARLKSMKKKKKIIIK